MISLMFPARHSTLKPCLVCVLLLNRCVDRWINNQAWQLFKRHTELNAVHSHSYTDCKNKKYTSCQLQELCQTKQSRVLSTLFPYTTLFRSPTLQTQTHTLLHNPQYLEVGFFPPTCYKHATTTITTHRSSPRTALPAN